MPTREVTIDCCDIPTSVEVIAKIIEDACPHNPGELVESKTASINCRGITHTFSTVDEATMKADIRAVLLCCCTMACTSTTEIELIVSCIRELRLKLKPKPKIARCASPEPKLEKKDKIVQVVHTESVSKSNEDVKSIEMGIGNKKNN